MQENIKRIQTTNDHLDDAVNFEPGMTCRLKCPACWRAWNADTLKADTQAGRRTNQKYDDVKIILETFGKIDACGNMSDPIYWILGLNRCLKTVLKVIHKNYTYTQMVVVKQ